MRTFQLNKREMSVVKLWAEKPNGIENVVWCRSKDHPLISQNWGSGIMLFFNEHEIEELMKGRAIEGSYTVVPFKDKKK